MKLALTLAALAMVITVPYTEAQETVFIIRHAEKDVDGHDPGLTEAGRARSAAWAAMLTEAEIDLVITTDARRTQETGRIIAEALGVERAQFAMADVTGLIDALGFDYADDRVLVVGHTETIPSILSGLGRLDAIEMMQGDYANLYIFSPEAAENARLIHLRMP